MMVASKASRRRSSCTAISASAVAASSAMAAAKTIGAAYNLGRHAGAGRLAPVGFTYPGSAANLARPYPVRFAASRALSQSRGSTRRTGNGIYLAGAGLFGLALQFPRRLGQFALRRQVAGPAVRSLGHRRRIVSAAVSSETSARLVSDSVKVPVNDANQYRVIELGNGMQVLLTSDPTADTSAAAMTLRCGTFQDPENRQGLAHFHEHMLFLGTEKYPKEDEYNKYLSEHGGDSNAFTMNEYTSYYFKVASPHFEGALDRFSQFFVGPTFTESCVEREMCAVDSESTNYSTEDSWRLLQVLKATSNEEHPFFRFDVGNLKTLQAETTRAAREELIKWNKEHYQAGAMRLAVVGRGGLDELQSMVTSMFGAVRGGAGKELKYNTEPWPKENLGKIVSCFPLKEARSLSVVWPLPPQESHLLSKPEMYLSHVFGHEGEGSLRDVLDQYGWVDQLSAGPSQTFSDGQLFAINISLTPEGDANREAVLALLFEFAYMVRISGPQEVTFNEMRALQEISFDHKEDSVVPDEFAANAAMSLHRYQPNEAIRGPFAVDEWKPDVIQDYMHKLTPENCLIFITSSAFEAEASQEGADKLGWKAEEWYGCPFKVEDIDSNRLQQWAVPSGQETGLMLPAPNQFVPTDFSLISTGADADSPERSKLPTAVTPPTLAVKTPSLRLWHKTDSAWQNPRQFVLGYVRTPVYDQGPRTVVLVRLFCQVVLDDLNSLAYDATIAGLEYNIDFSDAFTLSVGGFSDKLPLLLDAILDKMQQVVKDAESADADDGSLSERGRELMERIETRRNILVQEYRNFTREEPWSVCGYNSTQIMMRNTWNLSEYLEAADKPVSLKEIAAAAKAAFETAEAEIFVHGNTDAENARAMAEKVVGCLKALGSNDLEKAPRRMVTKLPAGTPTVFEYDLASKNPSQENSCTHNIYQVGPVGEDMWLDACMSIICHCSMTSAYQALRTEQQLGYIVQAGPWVEHNVCGLNVLVQGNKLAPHEVDERVETWIESYGQELREMSEDVFADNVQAIINGTTQRYSRMSQETTKHWGEIQPRRYLFDRIPRVVEAFGSISKSDVVSVFDEYIAANGPSRRKLSVRATGTSAANRPPPPDSPAPLTNIAEVRAFQASCETWPVHQQPVLPDPARS